MKFPEMVARLPQYIAFRRGYGAPLPANMTFSVIDRCNMACRTCGIWKNRDTDELTPEEYRKIVEPLDLYWVTITGGEAFMRDDIVEVVETIVNGTDAQYVTIATNGMLREKTVASMEELLEKTSAEYVLNFSVDGTSETHEHIRRIKDAFEKLSSTIEAVRALDPERINIGVNTVVSRFNEDEIPETYREVREKLEPDSFIAEVAEQRDKLYNEDMEFAPEDPDAALDFLIESLEEEKRRGTPRRVKMMRKGFYRFLKHDREMKNYTGFISAQLNPDGELWPNASTKRVMGDLTGDYDFEKVWRGRKAEKVREQIREENPQDMLANSFYNNAICQPLKFLELTRTGR